MTKFSVLMSVYEKESASYLNAAIESVWDFQNCRPNQIVLVKDGFLPTDLEEIVFIWKEKLGDVLTLVELSKNHGLAGALNIGIEYCEFDLVARMDSDDISLEGRFEQQVKFMEDNISVSVYGGVVEEWNEDFSRKLAIRKMPLSHCEIRKMSRRRSPVSHPSVIFRKKDVLAVGGYPEIYPEDYALWINMLNEGLLFSNSPTVFVRMRTGDSFYQRRGAEFLKGEIALMKKMFELGMISKSEYVFSVVARSVLRSCPSGVKKIAYKYFR